MSSASNRMVSEYEMVYIFRRGIVFVFSEFALTISHIYVHTYIYIAHIHIFRCSDSELIIFPTIYLFLLILMKPGHIM